MSGRFDYIKYDDASAELQAEFKNECEVLERMLGSLADGRNKALAVTKLEEFYMWVGKAIRDEQVAKRDAQLNELRG